MRIYIKIAAFASIAAFAYLASGTCNATTFNSGEKKVQLVELYSSQGCSSCPPAQRWLNNFSRSPELWSNVVPVVFHVDYWDYLGWKDPYSSSDYSARQRTYKRSGRANSVYTPGFFVQGNEWTGFFRRQSLPNSPQQAPELSVSLEQGQLTANYATKDTDSELSLNVAILAMNISTDVRAGENRNRTLKENFIVLDHITLDSNDGNWQSALTLPESGTELALAAWVTPKGSLQPLQATGGPLN